MTKEEVDAPRPRTAPANSRGTEGEPPEHAVRRALLDLLAEVGTVTATQAAGRLGLSSGLCSFHLRQLARYGHIEEVPHAGGRARPWRLRQAPAHPGDASSVQEGFGDLARGLEDESYQRWLAQRDQAPHAWRKDEAFSAVVYLTPDEMSTLATALRLTLERYQDRETNPSARPAQARPVALISRLFPLLPTQGGESAGPGDGGRDRA
ncbi:ArsR family transcriptional regulator [Streptomyces sp. NPDC006632]|uniref:ArsR/SmtB family transcription factor n=1 Tax=Streptomyces sp. NPDC006632 TaxID=3157182 RepID=UPI0033A0F30C